MTGGRALETEALDVPADPRQDGMPSRREGREVGHRGARHEADARPGGELEQLDEPAGRDLLRDGGGRRRDVEGRVLVPGGGQPVGAERGRQAAPDDEAEEARSGGRDEPGVGGGGESLDDRDGIGRTVGQRPAHRGPECRQVDLPADRSLVERGEVVGRERRGAGQGLGVSPTSSLLV